MPEIRAVSVGIVEKGLPRGDKRRRHESRYQMVSRIRIFDEYASGLAGLDGYSHLIVAWWMDQEHEITLRIRPERPEVRPGMPEVGVFATRFPPRPNPLGLTVVELVKMSGQNLTVRGLDAWTGAPVIDVKPYDYYDIVKAPTVPAWFKRFWDERFSKKRYREIAPWLGP